MRLSYFVSLVTALAIAGVFWYQETAAICPAPIAYHIGTLDPEFNLSLEQAKEHVAAAEAIWEAAAGRELFVYDESATLVVDFMFDERQALADSEVNQRAYLDIQKAENEKVFATVEELQREYKKLSATYQERVDSYEKELIDYNETVRSYNDQGGAPADEFARLEQQKRDLNEEEAALAKMSNELSALASKTNELGDRANQQVEAYNQQVVAYNKQFGFSREFTQGDYQDKRINIYKFSNENELRKVLAHELGHALGIDHVEEESSVMYYLLEDSQDTPVLSDDDKQALITVCGTGKEFSAHLRLGIRTVLAIF